LLKGVLTIRRGGSLRRAWVDASSCRTTAGASSTVRRGNVRVLPRVVAVVDGRIPVLLDAASGAAATW